jgi:hypothetical protein
MVVVTRVCAVAVLVMTRVCAVAVVVVAVVVVIVVVGGSHGSDHRRPSLTGRSGSLAGAMGSAAAVSSHSEPRSRVI